MCLPAFAEFTLDFKLVIYEDVLREINHDFFTLWKVLASFEKL